MFRQPSVQNTPRARRQVGTITTVGIPHAGMNARDVLSAMGPQFAVSLVNVICEAYGLRTRKGYTEWAKNIPGAMKVSTVMSYYPATASPGALAVIPVLLGNVQRMLVEPRADPVPPAGKLFAGTNLGKIYDVTAGGAGPWVAEVGTPPGVLSDFWTWVNFQNVAGRFLVVTNDSGGYAYYNGAAWTTPIMGSGAGQIDGVNPNTFCFVTEFKNRLWFIERDTTKAWYLPVSQITGLAKEFDFGEQFSKGGKLVALVNWTVDGGAGIDDQLVAVSSQGDVVIYKGTDPDTAAEFMLHGVWNVGGLPAGRRSVTMTGGDVHILSHFGITALSVLLGGQGRPVSYLISPLIARLMRDYATLPGWQIRMVPKEEIALIRIPEAAATFGGQFFCMKDPDHEKASMGTGWSILKDLPYQDIVSIDTACFAGTNDGRVVRAFDGPLDNVLIGSSAGNPIQCQVMPAFNSMGTPGMQKAFKLLRPTFLTTQKPSLALQIVTDYGPPQPPVVPSLPGVPNSLWNIALWDVDVWSGLQTPIKDWFGVRGVGFVGTAQLDYLAGGDTLLASIDHWTVPGGV